MSASWVISGNKKIARVSQKCGAAKALQIFWLLLSLLKNNPGENGYPCYNWNLGNSACTVCCSWRQVRTPKFKFSSEYELKGRKAIYKL